MKKVIMFCLLTIFFAFDTAYSNEYWAKIYDAFGGDDTCWSIFQTTEGDFIAGGHAQRTDIVLHS